jgi:hypothetical protein
MRVVCARIRELFNRFTNEPTRPQVIARLRNLQEVS